MGTSVGGKETLTSRNYLPEEAFPSQIKETQPSELEIEFKNGEVVGVNGKALNIQYTPFKKNRRTGFSVWNWS